MSDNPIETLEKLEVRMRALRARLWRLRTARKRNIQQQENKQVPTKTSTTFGEGQPSATFPETKSVATEKEVEAPSISAEAAAGEPKKRRRSRRKSKSFSKEEEAALPQKPAEATKEAAKAEPKGKMKLEEQGSLHDWFEWHERSEELLTHIKEWKREYEAAVIAAIVELHSKGYKMYFEKDKRVLLFETLRLQKKRLFEQKAPALQPTKEELPLELENVPIIQTGKYSTETIVGSFSGPRKGKYCTPPPPPDLPINVDQTRLGKYSEPRRGVSSVERILMLKNKLGKVPPFSEQEWLNQPVHSRRPRSALKQPVNLAVQFAY